MVCTNNKSVPLLKYKVLAIIFLLKLQGILLKIDPMFLFEGMAMVKFRYYLL